jgi:hypothetical protein
LSLSGKTGNAEFDVDLKTIKITKKVRCLQCPAIKNFITLFIIEVLKLCTDVGTGQEL